MASYFTTSRNFSMDVNVIYWIINGISYILNFIFSKVANLKIDNSSLYCHSYITANKSVTFDSTFFFFSSFSLFFFNLCPINWANELWGSPDNSISPCQMTTIKKTTLFYQRCRPVIFNCHTRYITVPNFMSNQQTWIKNESQDMTQADISSKVSPCIINKLSRIIIIIRRSSKRSSSAQPFLVQWS